MAIRMRKRVVGTNLVHLLVSLFLRRRQAAEPLEEKKSSLGTEENAECSVQTRLGQFKANLKNAGHF